VLGRDGVQEGLYGPCWGMRKRTRVYLTKYCQLMLSITGTLFAIFHIQRENILSICTISLVRSVEYICIVYILIAF